MCLDSGMLTGLLIFFLLIATAPFVIVAAVVHVVSNNRAEKLTRLLD
jgi:hypothetical protein